MRRASSEIEYKLLLQYNFLYAQFKKIILKYDLLISSDRYFVENTRSIRIF